MKTISNIIKTISFPLSVGMLSILLVVPAFAVEPNNGDNTEVKKEVATNVCTRITNFSTTGRVAISEKRTTLQTDYSKRLSGVSIRQTEVDQKVSDARLAAKTKFEQKIANLEAQEGLTDIQMAAIATYKTEVQAANTVRATAVDDARSAYRTGLATLVATNQQTLSSAVSAYQAAVTAAFETASANCTDANAVVTLATLKASIKAARDTLNTTRTPDTNKTAVKALAATRDAAIKSANDAFKTTVKALTVTLKAALLVTTDTAESTN